MSDGFAALQEQIDRLRSLSTMVPAAAPKIADELRVELERDIAAQQGPDGAAWPARKTRKGRNVLRSGAPVLANAAKHLTVRAIGTVVLARLDGVEARHHLGAVRGKVKRPILPTGEIPTPMVKAIDRVLTAEFTRRMNGAAPPSSRAT